MKNLVLWLLLCLTSADALAFGNSGASPLPVGDIVTSQSAADAFYSFCRVRTAYAGKPIQMRVLQSSVYVTQDIDFSGQCVDISAANTFAATADSGTPAEFRFYDQSPNGNNTAFVNTTIKGSFWSPYTLGKTALHSGANDNLYNNCCTSGTGKQSLNLPATMTMNMDGMSVAFIGRRGSSYPAKPTGYWEFSNTAPWNSSAYDYFTDNGTNVILSSGTKVNFGTVETGQGTYIYVMSPTTAVLNANGTQISRAKATLGTTANNGGQLGNTSLTGTWNGGQDMETVLFYNRALNSTEQAAIKAYGDSQVGDATLAPICVVAMGDSGTQAAFVADNLNPINQAISNVATPIRKPVRVYNTGTSGNTAADILANISRYTGTCGQTGVTTKIATVGAGANDLGSNPSAGTITSVLNTDYAIYTAMHNAGFKVVCITIQNTSSINSTGLNSFNTQLESTYAANNCDALADTWLDPNIGFGSNNLNTTYWYTDHIHLTINGNTIVGQYVANAANTQIP